MIDNDHGTFEEKEFLNSFKINLPNYLTPLPSQYAIIKYPSEFRPQIIVSTSDFCIDFCFNVYKQKTDLADIQMITTRIQSAIHREGKSELLSPVEILEKTKGVWFSFRSRGIGDDIFNMFLLLKLEKTVLQGSFNCAYNDEKKWKKVVLEMWETIQGVENRGYNEILR